jgi:hypothetical protein
MRNVFNFSLAAAMLLGLSFSSMGATSGDMEQEYIQVRKIALKDPRVQEAFQKANERLDERILQIDPSLKPIIDRQQAVGPATPMMTEATSHPPLAYLPGGRVHVVAKGETLTSIAGHYGTTVSTLEKLNHITNDRTLQIGQKLEIPGSTSNPAKPALENRPAQPAASVPPPPPAAAVSSPTPAKDDNSLLDKIKDVFN